MPDAQQKQLEPQLVLNRETSQYVNITPLFALINDGYNGEISALVQHLEKTIRFVSLNVEKESPGLGYVHTLEFLYELKDIFEGMSEFKQK